MFHWLTNANGWDIRQYARVVLLVALFTVPSWVQAQDVPLEPVVPVTDPPPIPDPTPPPVSSPNVLISELAWAGSSVSTSDEWVELHNPAAERRDLTGWSVWDVAATPPKLMLTVPAGQIGAGGYFLISNNGPDHAFTSGTSVLSVTSDVINSDVSLSNSALKLELRDATGVVMDTIGNGRAGFLRDTVTPRAMVRILPAVDGTVASSWELATEHGGLDMTAPDFGTPTPSGRPVITLPTTCRFVRQSTAEQTILGLSVSGSNLADPATVIDIRLGDTDIPANPVPTGTGLELRAVADSDIPAGPYQLTVVIIDPGGLTTIVSMPCDRVITGTQVEISEIVASPETDGQEFVELYNPGPTRAELYGWTLDDVDTGGSTLYKIGYPLIVQPGGFAVLGGSETKLKFNNSGDDIQLFDPAGTRVDLVRFKGDEKGQSWNRGTPWYWTSPSPGRANHTQPEIVGLGQGGSPSDEEEVVQSLPLATIVTDRAKLVGAMVSTEGTVSVSQGPHDKRRILLADGGSALEVQVPEDVTLTVATGDRIRISGIVSRAALPRILIEGMESVTKLSTKDRPVVTWSTSQLPALLQLVSVEGSVTKGGVSLELKTGERTIKTTRRSGVSFPENEVGDTLRLIGVVTSLDPLTLRVLEESDVTLIATLPKPELTESVEPGAVSLPEEMPETASSVSPKEQQAVPVLEIDLPNLVRLVPVALIADQLFELAIILGERQQAVGRMTPLLAGATSTSTPTTVAVVALLLCFGSSLALFSLGGDLLWSYLIRRVNGP